MLHSDLAEIRLASQHLTSKLFSNPSEVVRAMGAVQSQDFAAAKWSLGVRTKSPNENIVEEAFNRGEILRTHIMRPTWHFVSPENIRWILKLTSSRVQSANAHMCKKLELESKTLARSMKVISKSLKDKNFLTRTELSELLNKEKILAKGQRLAYIIMHAELEGLICSGPRRGKQFTYALLDERVPKSKEIDREESLKRLATIYFNSHGPAQVADFAWWSGLFKKEAWEAVEMAKLKIEEIDGKKYFFSNEKKVTVKKSSSAFLLSIFDEFTIAYKDRSALGEERYFEKLILMGNALTAVIILNGKIVGTWKRQIKKDIVYIKLSLFRGVDSVENDAIKEASEKYANYLDLSAIIDFSVSKF